MNKISLKDKVCFALDVDSQQEALYFVKLLKDYIGLFKIGMQLFTIEGPKVIEQIVEMGGKVFLDLKYHDIPNTVANAGRMAVNLGVSMFDIHASGGMEMMKAAVTAIQEEANRKSLEKPKILAITVLTSLNDGILQQELKISQDVESHVKYLAKLAQDSGADGVVCSPKEITLVRQECGKDFIILAPGIRPTWSIGLDDQKRVTTPRKAISLGADFIVIGRPLRRAKDPLEAAKKVLEEIKGVSGEREQEI